MSQDNKDATPTLTPLDAGYGDAIYDQLSELEIHLDADPLVFGPKRLNQKVSEARGMLGRCERIFLDVSQKLAFYKRAHRVATLNHDMRLKWLLANDPEVRAGRAVNERVALASGRMNAEVQALAATDDAIAELEEILVVLRAKRSDLRDCQGRLRDQVRLCQEEIGLGSRWGSKNPRGIELQPGQGFADGSDIEAIDAVIQSVRDVEIDLPAEDDQTDTDSEVRASVIAKAGGFKARSNEQLLREFGFAPHCADCGEGQYDTPSGLTCVNGHGGAESVPPPSNLLEAAGQKEAPDALVVGDQSDIDKFLSSQGTHKSRRQIEEEEMNLDDILSAFLKA